MPSTRVTADPNEQAHLCQSARPVVLDLVVPQVQLRELTRACSPGESIIVERVEEK